MIFLWGYYASLADYVFCESRLSDNIYVLGWHAFGCVYYSGFRGLRHHEMHDNGTSSTSDFDRFTMMMSHFMGRFISPVVESLADLQAKVVGMFRWIDTSDRG